VRAGQPHDADPAPGSDEINRAYEEGWVGNQAGVYWRYAGENGDKVPELFIVELPQSEQGWKQPGDAPLAGTQDPAGAACRRCSVV
jgi:hypothetical protein